MNARTTILLVVILVVLGVVATLTESNRKKQWKPTGNRLFPEYVKEDADFVDLTKGNLHVALAKKNGTWMVETEKGQPADTALVEGILGNLEGLTSDDLVSTKAESHPALEVDSTGVEVKVTTGGSEVAHLIVGKPGPDYMSTYIRPADQDNVYRVPVYLRTQVDRGDQTWRNRNVLTLSQHDIVSYSTTEGTTKITLTQETPGQWRMTAPQESAVDMGLLPMILQSMTNITAREFADSLSSLADAGLDPPLRTLEVETRSGERYLLAIGRMNEANQSHVKREGDETVFLVPAGRWNTIFRTAEELMAPDAPPDPTGDGEAQPGD